MKKLSLTLILATMVYSAQTIGAVDKTPIPAIKYCDNIVQYIEPKFVKLNERVDWFKNDVPLTAIQFEDFKYVVNAIPGMGLERIGEKHYQVYKMKVHQFQSATFHKTNSTIKQMNSGSEYKKKLRTLISKFASPSGLDEFVGGLKWVHMSGGCTVIEVNLNKLLPW